MQNNQPDINSPKHYKLDNIEAIEVISQILTNEQFKGYCLGNVLKYLIRHEKKEDPIKDLQKANWYLNRLLRRYFTNENKTNINNKNNSL